MSRATASKWWRRFQQEGVEGPFILARAMRDGGHMRCQLRLLRQMLELLLLPRRPGVARRRVQPAAAR